MTEGPFGLPRPFAESKPVVKVIIEESQVPTTEGKDELYSGVLYDFEEMVGYSKTDSIMVGSDKDEGFELQYGMVHFAYDVSSLTLRELSHLHKAVDGVFEDYETVVEVV